MTTIKATNIYYSFRRKIVINGISFELKPGCTALLGPNGSGKTTLIRILTELYRCQKGEIYMDGQCVTNQGILPTRIGYLPQKFGVFSHLTARETLKYLAGLKNVPVHKQEKEVERCLYLTGLEKQADLKGKALSGGMVRRLGIAQTLLGNPDFLIFDEPTTGLDPEERIRFKLLIQREAAGGKVILLSTHIVEDIEALANHILGLANGKLIINDSRNSLKRRADGKVWRIPGNSTDIPKGVYIRTMKEIEGEDQLIVLSDKPVGTAVIPTLEDGYLVQLKRIGSSKEKLED